MEKNEEVMKLNQSEQQTLLFVNMYSFLFDLLRITSCLDFILI